MRIPVMRPTKFTSETKEVLDELSRTFNSGDSKKLFPQFHKDNIFNRRFSGVLDAFNDLNTVTERLEETINLSIKVEKLKRQDEEIDQELYRKSDKLTSEMKADFKALYVYSKIFLDQYTDLLRFIFKWRHIGDKSVTNFYNSLEKYTGDDIEVISFKKECLGKLKAVDTYITQYRDIAVVHNQQKHKEPTKWFLNNMNGEIMMLGGNRSSVTPQEMLFIVVEYVDCSVKFCFDWMDRQSALTDI